MTLRDRCARRHSQVVNSGETATMNCTVEGYPVESVEWLHDGVPVLTAQDTRIRLLAPLVLVIGSVGRRDKGMYQCLVRSDKENAQATSELKLGGQQMFLIPVLYPPWLFHICSRFHLSLYILNTPLNL